MSIRNYKAYTPGTRNRSVSNFNDISKIRPEKSLTSGIHQPQGRNNRGIITSRHRGGGHKKLYREIDFKRNKIGIAGKVMTIEYDPNRNSRIALLHYKDGDKKYILYPHGLELGETIIALSNTNSFQTIFSWFDSIEHPTNFFSSFHVEFYITRGFMLLKNSD